MEGSSEQGRDVLYAEMIEAQERMERERAELARITREVRADPSRQLNDDAQAWQKNMELSRAIQEYLRLEKQYYKENSQY